MRIERGVCSSASDPKLSAVLKEVNELCAASSVSMVLDVAESHLHSGLAQKVVPKEIATPSKRILVLGAGFVSAPLVDYLLRRRANHLTVASMIAAEAEALAHTRARVTPVQLDVFKVRCMREEGTHKYTCVCACAPTPLSNTWPMCAHGHACCRKRKSWSTSSRRTIWWCPSCPRLATLALPRSPSSTTATW